MTDANSDFTPRLGMPFLLPNQAQKHVTVNEALRTVDALLMAAVETRALSEPPAAPETGSAYLVGSAPVGDWAGQAARLAIFQDNEWAFLEPRVGWRCWVKDESALVVFESDDWQLLSGGAGALQNLPLLGIGTEAAEPNRLSVKSDAVLLAPKDGGAGDLRITMNKTGAAAIGALSFQTDYALKAEVGLLGNDALTFKTFGAASFVTFSVDGSDALVLTPSYLDAGAPMRLASYASGSLPSAASAGAGAMIYATATTSGDVVAVSDGTAWTALSTGAGVS